MQNTFKGERQKILKFHPDLVQDILDQNHFLKERICFQPLFALHRESELDLKLEVCNM